MAKAHTTWKVLPHGPLTKLEDDLWTVEGSLEGMPLKRVMTVVRRSDGSLAVHNAIALSEAGMKELESLGPVKTLIVPNGWHRLDAPLFHERYPDAKVVCPVGARAKVSEVVPVDFVYDDAPNDDVMSFLPLEGIKRQEGVVAIKSGAKTTLVFNDALFNMPHLPGVKGFVLRHLTQSSGPLHVSRVFRVLGIQDKAAFKANLKQLADTPNLARIIVGHHVPVDTDAPAALRSAADTA